MNCPHPRNACLGAGKHRKRKVVKAKAFTKSGDESPHSIGVRGFSPALGEGLQSRMKGNG